MTGHPGTEQRACEARTKTRATTEHQGRMARGLAAREGRFLATWVVFLLYCFVVVLNEWDWPQTRPNRSRIGKRPSAPGEKPPAIMAVEGMFCCGVVVQ